MTYQEMPACPVCDASAVPLGTLGFLDHWRCRDCGAQWATDNRLNDEA